MARRGGDVAATGGRIALVDDEPAIRETVGFALRREGFEVETFADGEAAWDALGAKPPELAILDIRLPRLDGRELCRRLRARSEALPIVFLTSCDDEFDRVLGLELGADDYLCKPFSMRELLARVKVQFRRASLLASTGADTEPSRRLDVGPLVMDLDRYTVLWNEDEVALTVTEFRLLRALARRPGHVRTRRQLLEDGYPDDAWVAERTVDSHIKRIRRKFQDADAAFDGLETVHGLGYRYRECLA